MNHRGLISAALLGVLASMLPQPGPVAAQAPTATEKPFTPPKSSYVPPKTPWGDPDLQGIYDYKTIVPIERPAELAGKPTLTDAERAELAKRRGRVERCGEGSRAKEKCPPATTVGSYGEEWNNLNPAVRDNRTSLLIDPPNGRFPALTPEGETRRREILSSLSIPEGSDIPAGYASWEDFYSLTRCIASQTPNGPMGYNSGTYIMQSPGWVMIVRERLDTRIIPIDGRPHIGQKIRQWNGHSVGHWEGNVLVVDTTNFTDKQRLGGGYSGIIVRAGIPFGNFHLTERFVPVSAKRIEYYATVEDPKTWTKPWTIMIPWEIEPGYKIYEYACNEGNYSIGLALQGERKRESEGATERK